MNKTNRLVVVLMVFFVLLRGNRRAPWSFKRTARFLWFSRHPRDGLNGCCFVPFRLLVSLFLDYRTITGNPAASTNNFSDLLFWPRRSTSGAPFIA